MTTLRTSGVLMVTVALMLAGCGNGSDGSAAPPSPAPTPVANCVTADEQKSGGVRLAGDKGLTAPGVILGTGDTGVVLSNQSSGDLCQWKTVYAARLLQAGYRVLAFNYSGGAADKDVTAAIGALREAGVNRVFLMGASMGGTASLAAAAVAQPPVAGVISISAPRAYAGVDALAAMPALKVPVLFVVAEYDEPFAGDAQTLHDACASPDKKISIEVGRDHGVTLLSQRVSGMVDTFLKEH